MKNIKVLQMKENDELIVLNDKVGISVKNINGVLNIKELEKEIKSNIFIKTLNMNELNSLILTRLLEDNEMACHRKLLDNHKLINKMLDNQFNFICGNSYSTDEIENIEFQAITYFETEKDKF